MKIHSAFLLVGFLVLSQAHATLFAYRKYTTLYLRDLPNSKPSILKNNDLAVEVDSSVGAFKTLADGVLYLDGDRLKFATLELDKRGNAQAKVTEFALNVVKFSANLNGNVVAYMDRSGNLWVKPGLGSEPAQQIAYSINSFRVNQDRIFYTDGSLSFVAEFVPNVKTAKLEIVITELKDVPSNSVLAEESYN